MSIRSRVKAFPLSDYRADENGAYRTPQNAQRNIFAAPLPVPPLASQDGTPPPLLIPARPALLDCSPAMPCCSQYHRISSMMSSDVILDTVPCLPYRRHLVFVPSSSRIGYRMISKRNPSHAISDTTTSASPNHLPAPSHRPTASRPASRRTVSPDGSAQGPTPSGSLLASPALLVCLPSSHSSPHLIGSSVPPVACPPYQPHAVAPCHPFHAAHPSRPSHPYHPLHSISSAHQLISRPAPLPALLPAGRPASPTCSPRLSHPSHPLRSISLAHRPAPSDETSDEQAKRRMEQAIDDEKQGTTTSDASQIPQMPIPARRIASTSRITHRHPHEHAHGKTPPPSPSQRL